MNNKFEEFFKNCNKNPSVLENKLMELDSKLPENYINFLKFSNGIEGEVSNGSYLQLWKLEDLENLNEVYKTKEFIPGMFFIGGDGGNEAVGIDMRSESSTYGNYFRVPFMPIDWKNAILMGSEITDIKII